MAYETAASIINDAAILLGLEGAVIAAPLSSTRQHIIQLAALLTAAGRDLVREHQWSHLEAEHFFSTTPGEDTYSMPADFDRHLDNTQHNRTTALPLAGPLSGQRWQAAKVLSGSTGVEFYFRTQGPRLVIHPVPTSAQSIALEYLSAYWVQSAAAANRDKARPTADDDLVCFDGPMMVHRLRRDFLRAKGFDSSAASEAYELALANAKGANAAGEVKSLNSLRAGLPAANLPASGWAV